MVTDVLSNWCSAYQEAFACWIIENNIDKWTYEKINESQDEEDDNASSFEDGIDRQTSEGKEKRKEGVKKNKFTNPFSGNTKYRSWTKEGILRFNEYVNRIKDQRGSAEGKIFEAAFKRHIRKSRGLSEEGTDTTKEKKKPIEEYEEILDGLSGDEDEEEEEKEEVTRQENLKVSNDI